MSNSTFEVGQKVTILDVNKVGEIESVSEDGSQFSVKYTDDAGAEQTEVCTADKLAAVSDESEGESKDESAANDKSDEDEKSQEEEV